MTAFDGEHIIFAESSNIQITNRQVETAEGGFESAVTFSIPTHRREITCLDFDQGNLLKGIDKRKPLEERA